ncbi:RNA-guided endonuclease InsQ/TnpB family protein [Candidatus Nitrosotalea okcheonensis]|uniref:Transposase n=1 Tax=Candidatus Nitrosotalea okcheonensis TaxID=1903276 RepID=A0A2H1FHT5_9ARCH|nr:RNA-guided endonuclease TnpB family protein [Candidatus Nitrosotalea okcheonensis]SMH72252.1 transposase [Candidatus Nitrosotalea okcheonensis]
MVKPSNADIFMMAIKSIKQNYVFPNDIVLLMETFKEMVNFCIKTGLQENISTLNKFSSLHYKDLFQFDIQSKYKLTAMSQAMGRLAQRKRDMKKGRFPKSPYVSKPYLVSCYGFKINGMLLSFPVSNGDKFLVKLNEYTISKLDGTEPRSFTITPSSISISVRKEIKQIIPENVIGIDRNLRNVTISTNDGTVMYKTNKLLSIKENTSHVLSSFKRFDVRLKRHFQQRLGNRRSRRIQQHLHKITKDIIQRAVASRSMIILEDLKGIRKLYHKGNGQGTKYRRKLNSWSFYELQRQIQYKAEWKGIPVGFIDPKRTSQLCPVCGERLQEDRFHRRKLLCNNCKRSMNRDVIASMNISYKGWSRFCHPRGLSDEVVKGNLDNFQPIILGVDGSKLEIQR